MDQDRIPDNTPDREPDQGGPGPRRVRPGRIDQSGQDSRKRGWFWHWNEIITQYAPLIGLKGVGLLNSYTTWTDRREHSPHRGYAFPTQKSEAAFYGEDRAELITINKILTALDLIEIRKEMVTKPDDKGRQWKVPHNFYRVKDRQDGLTLTTEDVLRVVELADRDPAIYRYVRRIFSPRFEPIDRHNVWHTILEEIADDPTWRKLCEKTARQESRASARTRAGHRTRAKVARDDENRASDDGESRPDPARLTSGQYNEEALRESEQDGRDALISPPSVARTNQGPDTTDAPANTGLDVDDAPANEGCGGNGGTYDGTTNTGTPSSVEPPNTMYNQSSTTTTTTTSRVENEFEERTGPSDHGDPEIDAPHPVDRDSPEPDTATGQASTGDRPAPGRGGSNETGRGPDHTSGWGPLGDPSALVVSLFEAANDRPATRLERILLSELERDATPAAERTGATGAEWVAAALREAVSSGSAFVAPKRIQEIINRWASEGRGERAERNVTELESPGKATQARLSSKIWNEVLAQLKRQLEESVFDTLFTSSACVEQASGVLVVRVRDEYAAGKLDREYRPLVERVAARVVGAAISIEFVFDEPPAPEAPGSDPSPGLSVSDQDWIRGRQLWDVVLNDLTTVIASAEQRRLAGCAVLGEDGEGRLLVGADRRSAVELLQHRHKAVIEAALARFMQRDAVTLRALGPEEWTVMDEVG